MDMNTLNELSTSREFYALGTSNILKAYGPYSKIAIYEGMHRILDFNNKMSIFKDSSEFSLINNNAGDTAVSVSTDTFYVLEKAIHYAALTSGAFDPTIRPLVDLWGIDKNDTNIPSEEEINRVRKLVNYKDIQLNAADYTVKLMKKGQRIDGGSIVKGFVADEVKKIFVKNGIENAIIDLGGNISVLGSKPDGTPWMIGIRNPLGSSDEIVGALSICDKSVVTSGSYERYIMKHDKKYSHIIDPRTGYPADSQIISATIISNESIAGDALSTHTYVSGVEEGIKFIESLDSIDAVLITNNREVYISSGLKECFILTDNTYSIKEFSL